MVASMPFGSRKVGVYLQNDGIQMHQPYVQKATFKYVNEGVKQVDDSDECVEKEADHTASLSSSRLGQEQKVWPSSSQ